MTSTSDMVYISVESRKGGVGKTTVSLTLAENLLQNGYQVLMFDMDIIGTRIDKRFFEDRKRILHEVTVNNKAINLLDLYKNVYLVGKNTPVFSTSERSADNNLTMELGMCNFIGSDIYGDNPKNTPLEDPRVLYDAFHAYWLLEFVKKIAISFAKAVGVGTRIAIILDNSPGFSSIENCIHDFLTNIGPEKGKVLLVSTIDPQDLEACRQSQSALKSILEDKITAGEYYRSLLESGKGKKLKSEAFVSVWNSLCASDGKLPSYYSRSHKEVSSFVNILVNKVPRTIHEQLFVTQILKKDDEISVPFLYHLLYYYSGPMLEGNGIQHQHNFNTGFEVYSLSGDFSKIADDDVKYNRFRVFTEKAGLGVIFKPEWSPKTPFKALWDYLKKEEALKNNHVFKLPKTKRITAPETSDVINVVRKIVLSYLDTDSVFMADLPEVEEYTSYVLTNAKINGEINFQTDNLSSRLQRVEEFLHLFCFAAYRLCIYEKVCGLFNGLMSYCLENVEKMEMLDKEFIENEVLDLLEGRKAINNVEDTISRLISDHRNARELGLALNQIIKLWGLL